MRARLRLASVNGPNLGKSPHLHSIRPQILPVSAWYNLPYTLQQCREFTTYYSVPTKLGSIKIDALRAPQYIGHSTTRSMQQTNEDTYSVGFLTLPIRGEPQPVFSASVFDGHGGDYCAKFLEQNLAKYVEEADIEELAPKLQAKFRKRFGGYWRTALILNAASLKKFEQSKYDDLAVRLPLAFLQADYDEMDNDQLTGSTCTAAYLYATDPRNQFWFPGADVNVSVAQVGDTRAIICDNRGNYLPLSAVHHADSPREGDRLARFSMGFNSTTDGLQRFLQYVNTRAFGDHQGKSRGITAEPEVTEYHAGPGRGRLPGNEAFLVLVSDGVTDKASDQEICDIVIQQAMQGGSMRGTPQDAANEIISYVSMLGTFDNATALVIRLGGWGEWNGWRDISGSLRVQRVKHVLRRQ